MVIGKRILTALLSAAMLCTTLPAGLPAVGASLAAISQPKNVFTSSAEGTGVDLGDGISWPLGQALPSFQTPEATVDTIQAPANDVQTFALLTALQGIVNRKKPRLMVYSPVGTDEKTYWNDLVPNTNVMTSATELFVKYRDEVKGLVVYDPAVPDTLNLASTYAGLHDCLPVTPSQAAIYSANPYNLEVKETYVGKFSSKVAVYDYLAENLMDDCNKRLIAGLNPETFQGVRDMAVATKSAQVNLDPEKAEELAVLEKLYDKLLPNESYHIGWWPGAAEKAGVSFATRKGVSTLGSDFFNNMTVYAGQSRELNPPTVPAKPKLENKLYVAMMVSDGDNLQFTQHHQQSVSWWRSRNRGKIPITWTSSPVLLDAAPQILNRYYKEATDNDFFVDGPSGVGYTLTEDWVGYDFDLVKHMQLTNKYFEKTQMNMSATWNNMGGFLGTMAENCPSALGFTFMDPEENYLSNGFQPCVYEKDMSFLSLGAGFCYVSPGEANGYLANIDRYMQADRSEPQFLLIQFSPWEESTIDELYNAATRAERQYSDRIEFVRADHLFMLRSEYEGMPFNVGLRAKATASGADGSSTADKAVDGSFAQDKGWASSNSGAKWLQLDLGGSYDITRYTLKNAEAGYLGAANNTKAWQFQVSPDGKTWRTVDTVTDNTDAITYRSLSSETAARYVRVYINDPGADGVARIQDLEVYGRAGAQVEDGLQYGANGEVYFYENNAPVKNDWRAVDGVWYYFGSNGAAKTGWFTVGGKWYYTNRDAMMLTGWFKEGSTWYFLNSSGAMATGWKKIGPKWYYFGTNGKMRTGWYKDGSKWYYSDSSGAMATGWKKLGSKWYYLGSDGKMRTGWYKVGKTWYYSDGSGAMKTGWFAVGKKWYFTNGSGAMQTGWLKTGGKWYWLNSSGAMQTGWKKLGSKWYWFDGSGRMLAGTSRKIGKKTYRFNSSGTCLNP